MAFQKKNINESSIVTSHFVHNNNGHLWAKMNFIWAFHHVINFQKITHSRDLSMCLVMAGTSKQYSISEKQENSLKEKQKNTSTPILQK